MTGPLLAMRAGDPPFQNQETPQLSTNEITNMNSAPDSIGKSLFVAIENWLGFSLLPLFLLGFPRALHVAHHTDMLSLPQDAV